MTSLEGLLRLLDARSFASLWYWLVLIGAWSLGTRNVLGVPGDIIQRARRASSAQADPADGLLLLDWLSLMLPRWRPTQLEAGILVGAGAFSLSCLAVLGFAYGRELAQALVLLLTPFGLLAVLRFGLARRLDALLEAARKGDMPATEAAALAGRMMMRHRRATTVLSLFAIALTTGWGTLWNLTHPYRL